MPEVALTNEASLDNTATEEENHDIRFQPIVNLPETTIPTNEEDEELLVKLRAKLYRFDASNKDEPEWKERGTGEVKFLKHNDNHTVRIVMRRDKTLKVCANHFVTPKMELKPSINSDRAFIYSVAGDFADETIKSECLAIKFANVEAAKLFKEKFDESKIYVSTSSLYTTNHAIDLSNSNDDVASHPEEDVDDEDDEISNLDDESTTEITKKMSELITDTT